MVKSFTINGAGTPDQLSIMVILAVIMMVGDRAEKVS